MIDAALSEGYEISLATNCKVLSASDKFNRFIEAVGERKEKMRIITTRDKYHLKTFDPEDVIERLKACGLEVSVNYYANNSLIITEYNRENKKPD